MIYWTNLVKITHMWRRWGTPPNFFLANLDDMTSSWDIEQNILKLVILGHFLPFYPSKTPKIRILKIEKIRFIWCTVSGIRSETQNFLSFWTIFYIPPYGNRKSKFWKNEKIPEVIIISQMRTKNDNHMIMVPNILSVTDRIFCHFGPLFALTTWKIKILKK